MRKLIALTVLYCASSWGSDDIVTNFFHSLEMDIENYEASQDVKDSVRSSYKNRATLDKHTQAAVDKMWETYNSAEFRRESDKWTAQIAEMLGTSAWESPKPESKALPYSGRPILFVSSSMPTRTLRTYAEALERVNGAMVIRGFVGGVSELAPTLRFIGEFLKIDPSCDNEPCDRRVVEVLIDPILFREYGIRSVPAFTIHGQTELDGYCKGTAGLNASGVVVYGDNSVDYLITRYAHLSGDTSALKLLEN